MRTRERWILLLLLVTLAARSVSAQTSIRYVYDQLGRLIAVVDPGGDTAVYHYDAVGNVLSIDRHASSQVSIIAFSPGTGPVGTTVAIDGTGFSATASQDAATFNGTAATISSATTTRLIVTVPAGATTGTIAVTAPAGSATSATAFVVGSANTPTITSFTPAIGIAGATVTVTGTNFETTPANDRANLNLTFAPVSAATTTSLTTAVPAATGSGPITVATPGGIAVSATDLFVPPSPYIATDVEFTSRMTMGGTQVVTISTASKLGLVTFAGTAGQRVSLKGTNGLSGQVVACDVYVTILKPNISALGTATCMEISGFIDVLTLPATGTYTILVDPSSTATGSVTLTLYNVGADVSGTITPGGSAVTVTIATPGQNAGLTFAGSAAQRISLKGTNGMSGQILGCDVNVSILRPDKIVLAPATCMELPGFIDVTALATTGTYTIVVDPVTTATGSLTLTLYDVPADVTATMTPGGSAVTVTTTTPGQNAAVTFAGTAGQLISLKGTSGMSGQILGCDVNVSILKPDSSVLVAATCMEGSGFIDVTTVPTTGTYTVVVDPVSTAAGSLTLTLYTVSDFSGTITPGGSPVTVTITTPGQNGALTFSGTQGQRISLHGTNGTIAGQIIGCDVNVSIRKPDSTVLVGATCMDGSGFIDATTLPTTGTYTIVVDPVSTATGNLPLTLYSVPADSSVTLTIGGASATPTTSTPGQNAQATFSGTSGQQVTVHLTANGMGSTTVKLLKPDGSQLTSSTSSASSFNLATQTLPTTGTYTITIDPGGANVGSITVSVSNP